MPLRPVDPEPDRDPVGGEKNTVTIRILVGKEVEGSRVGDLEVIINPIKL